MIKLDLRSPLYHKLTQKKKRAASSNDNILKVLELELSHEKTLPKKQEKICCPNCRFVFQSQNNKIAHDQIGDNGKDYPIEDSNNGVKPNNDNNNTSKTIMKQKDMAQNKQKSMKKVVQMKQVQIQTQQVVPKTQNIKQNSKEKDLSSENNVQQVMTQRVLEKYGNEEQCSTNKKHKTDIFPSYCKQLIPSLEQQENNDHEKYPFKKMKTNKQNIVNPVKNKTILQQFPVKKAYLQSNKNVQQKNNQKSIQIINEHICNLKPVQKQKQKPQQMQQNQQFFKIFHDSDLLLSQIKLKLSNQQYRGEQPQKLYLREQIAEIINYQMNLPQKSNIPSYCKMLAYQIQDCGHGSAKKQIEHHGEDAEISKDGHNENFRINDFDAWNDNY